jgi:hypothetical protein
MEQEMANLSTLLSARRIAPAGAMPSPPDRPRPLGADALKAADQQIDKAPATF